MARTKTTGSSDTTRSERVAQHIATLEGPDRANDTNSTQDAAQTDVGQSAIDCEVCHKLEAPDKTTHLTQCTECEKYFHLVCLKYLEDEDEIEELVCDDCDHKSAGTNITHYKSREASDVPGLLYKKRRHYYIVDAIISRKIVDGKLLLKCHWGGELNKPSRGYLPEENFDCAMDLVKRYRRENSLGTTTVTPYVRASERDLRETNIANWPSISDVLSKINSLHKFHKIEISSLKIGLFVSHSRGPAIGLLVYGHHLFIIYQNEASPNNTIADGGNTYLNDAEIRHAIDKTAGSSFKPLRYDGPVGVDHCATSGVLIAHKFCQYHKSGKWPIEEIVVPHSLKVTLQRAFHKYPSTTMKEAGIAANFSGHPQCKYCNKTLKRAALHLHQRACEQKMKRVQL